MTQKTKYILLISFALVYFWAFPLGKLTWQFFSGATGVVTLVDSVEAPEITNVHVLPAYKLVYYKQGIYKEQSDTRTIIIVGKNFKSLDENLGPVAKAKVIIDGKEFAIKKSREGPQTENFMIELDVPASALSEKSAQVFVSVMRDKKLSKKFAIQTNNVQRQLEQARSGVAKIIAINVVGYPLNEYGDQALNLRILFSGLMSSSPEGKTLGACSLRVDDENFDCHEVFNFEHPNIFDWRVGLGKSSHTIALTVRNQKIKEQIIDTVSFEHEGKERQRIREGYYTKLSKRELSSGRQIPVVGQNKYESFQALGINFIATVILLLLFRPWRHRRYIWWFLPFGLVVIFQSLVGVIYGILLSGGDFLAPVVGSILAVLSVYNGLIPLAEAVVISYVLHKSFQNISQLSSLGSNAQNI